MRKIFLIIATVTSVGAITISAPDTAQARFGAGAMAESIAGLSPVQPAQYSGGYRQYPSYYGAYAYAPSPSRNYWYNAPASVYSGSREALDSCALC